MQKYYHDNVVDEFTTDEMLEFYKKLDVLRFKYDLQYPGAANYNKEKDPLRNWDIYNMLHSYEESQQLGGLTKKNYANDSANYDFVYDHKGKRKKHIELLQMITDKIINQYIGIDGIERLFSETYIEFEWEMHLGVDYKKHGLRFYRDHFFHQIRDAFMIHILLQDYNFYDNIKSVLMDKSASKISVYVQKMLAQQMNKENGILNNIYHEDTKLREFFLRNLVYMSLYMAALFHDIGYPETFYISTDKRIREYLPEVSCLNGSGMDLGSIRSALDNSLLFRLVSFDEIESRLFNKDKADHGVYSAIIFLMHFYGNGAIFGLEPYKKAAVEIAALAIYNHTNRYEVQHDENTVAYRPCFKLNPISYLLRICDDLQEWERIYFLLTNNSNILLCNRCHTPLLNREKNGTIRYICSCNADKEQGTYKEDPFCRAFGGLDRFHYRRIYNITVCNSVKIIAYSNEGKMNKNNKLCQINPISQLHFKLEYEPYKLLHAAFLNPGYARSRISELNDLKKITAYQSEIPDMYFNYFVTSNPIFIKVKILEEYLKKNNPHFFNKYLTKSKLIMNYDKNHNNIENILKSIKGLVKRWRKNYIDNMINELLAGAYYTESDNDLYHKHSKTLEYRQNQGKNVNNRVKLEVYLNSAIDIYFYLLAYMELSKILNGQEGGLSGKKNNVDGIKVALGIILNILKKETLLNHEDVWLLIEDCLLQSKKLYSVGEYYHNPIPSKYYKQFIPRIHKYYDAQIRFVNPNNYIPYIYRTNRNIKSGGEILDAYTDLYIFKLIGES